MPVSSGTGHPQKACRRYALQAFLFLVTHPEEEELPEDNDESDRYVVIPGIRDFDLGQPLVFRFVDAKLPQHYKEVEEIFRKKDAYGRFSRLIDSLGMRDKWHRFREEQTEAALREWCAENGLELRKKR
ncbi:UPF0158 family protein [Massilia horti]|uniref:UPF0158 family protein n=1 Tax=Massilia horti TaxID=2562153 RepID=UPI0014302A2B|nr:UPF0158 family protein [Massilia horti]